MRPLRSKLHFTPDGVSTSIVLLTIDISLLTEGVFDRSRCQPGF